MNRRQLRQLAELRNRDSRALLRARCYSGAYYLAGYAVECALKACVARRTRRFDFPDRSLALEVWTHDLKKLLVSSALGPLLAQEAERSPSFEANWSIVKAWSEGARYRNTRQRDARELLRAINDPVDGINGYGDTGRKRNRGG